MAEHFFCRSLKERGYVPPTTIFDIGELLQGNDAIVILISDMFVCVSASALVCEEHSLA
ncbi:MAG: hypothetical protein AAF974_09400 [Cyanobacteria bacterium P01_E01_bin.34]